MMNGFEITELDRRISNLIQVGTVSEADYPNAKLKVKIGEIITDWLPWLTRRSSNDTTWWAPEVGEQVIVLAPSGELKQAVILPALYQNAHPAIDDNVDISKTVYKDGTFTTYNRDSHIMTVNVNNEGKIEVVIGASTITMIDTEIELKNGASTVTLTDPSIELKNGGSSIKITGSDIKISAPRIDWN